MPSLKVLCQTIFVCLLLVNGAISQETLPCQKIDFNRPEISEFKLCYQQFLPVLKIKKYTDVTDVAPYRSSSQFFLSTVGEGLSCMESASEFSLNENSIIQLAVYLAFVDAGASASIIVLDLNTNREAYTWTYNKSGDWLVVEEKVDRVIPRAMIEIRTNMNKRSVLAIEYLNVANSKLSNSECVKEQVTPRPPTTAPTTITKPPPVTTPSTTSTSTTEYTEENPVEYEASGFSFRNYIWTIVSCALGLLAVILIAAVIYVVCFRKVLTKQKATINQSMDEQRDDPLPLQNLEIPDYPTIPRLFVVHDPIHGPSISGVDYNQNLEDDFENINLGDK